MRKGLIVGAIVFDLAAAAGTVVQIWLQRATVATMTNFIDITASVVDQSGIRECRGALDTLRVQVGAIRTDEQILISILGFLLLAIICKVAALVVFGRQRATDTRP